MVWVQRSLDPFNWCLSTSGFVRLKLDRSFLRKTLEMNPGAFLRMVEELGLQQWRLVEAMQQEEEVLQKWVFCWIWQLKFGEDRTVGCCLNLNLEFLFFCWNSLEFVEFLNENHPPYQQIVSKGINISLQIVNNPLGHFSCGKKTRCVALPISAANLGFHFRPCGLSLIRGDGGKTPKTKHCGDCFFGEGGVRVEVKCYPLQKMPSHVRWFFAHNILEYFGAIVIPSWSRRITWTNIQAFIILYGRPCKSNISEATETARILARSTCLGAGKTGTW